MKVCSMADPSEIYNWRRFDDRIRTSGQPSEERLAALAALCIRHVINLGLHSHEDALPDEAGSLSALGMTYIHIPVDFNRPTDAQFTQFCEAMAMIGSQPVHIHCIANKRVTAFLYRWKRDVCGVKDDQARALMHSVWQPDAVWAAFVGDEAPAEETHRPGK